MIADLLTPEAQADAYVWAAVLVAHAGIGAALWVLVAGWFQRPWFGAFMASVLYLGFETVQGLVAGRLLIWDSLLDWSAVTLGALLASAIWAQYSGTAKVVVLAVGMIAAAGAWVRKGRR